MRYDFEGLTDKEIELIPELCPKRKFEWERNIRRDEKGRLNKGAKLTKKDIYDENRIKLLISAGMPVKEIVKRVGYSKSTVYRMSTAYQRIHKYVTDW